MESYQQPEDDKHEFYRVEIKEEVFFDETEEQIDGIQEESGIINDIKEENVCFDPTNVQSITPDVVNEENVLLTRIKKEVVYDDTEFINKEETDYAWPEHAPREIDPLAVPGIKYENEFGNTERRETVASGSRSITGFESLWFKEHDFGCELDDEEKPNNVSTTSNLEQHKGLHKCNVCEYACSTLGDLKTHRKKHSGEKPYKCNLCEYASSMSGNLNRHMKRHTGEQPYKCSLCEYTSSQSGNLDKHMRSHRGERTNGTNVGEYGRFYRKVLATKLEMENGKLVVKRKWDDQEKAVLQIADNHLPATESSGVIKSRRESSKTRDLTEDEKILRKRQLASERLRRFREKKQVSKDLATTVEEILHKIEATENEKLLRKRQLARERLRRFREKKKQASKDLTTDEEILRKKEAARKRSRKYRENQRLKRSNVIQDSQLTAPSRLPDDNSLVKQPTIHDSQDSGSSRTPIEKDISFEPICNLFIESTTVNREIVLPDQTNLLARDVAQDEKILHKRESERERIRKYREKKAESKDLISDEEISHKKESAKEWSRKYRQKKRLQQLNFNVIHNSQIAGPSLLHDDQSYGKQATDHNSLGGISRTECAPSHLDDSFEPVI